MEYVILKHLLVLCFGKHFLANQHLLRGVQNYISKRSSCGFIELKKHLI